MFGDRASNLHFFDYLLSALTGGVLAAMTFSFFLWLHF